MFLIIEVVIVPNEKRQDYPNLVALINSLGLSNDFLKSQLDGISERINEHSKKNDSKFITILESMSEMRLDIHDVASRTEINSKWISDKSSSSNETMNFIYRSIILIVITYIAYKVGIVR